MATSANLNEPIQQVREPLDIREARELHLFDAQKHLFSLITALYEYRRKVKYENELLSHRLDLIDLAYGEARRARVLLSHNELGPAKLIEWAERAELMATILFWMSGRWTLSESECDETRRAALAACELYAFPELRLPARHYAKLQIDLTMATVLAALGKRVNDAECCVWNAEIFASDITAARERAAVYRKIGIARRNLGNFEMAVVWGIRACFAWGIPLRDRLESAKKLFDPDW